MKKPQIIIAVVVLLLLVGGIGFAAKQFMSKPTEETETNKKKKVAEPVNVIPVEERPFLEIEPQADGRNVILRVSDIKKEATEVDYELEYQSGSLLQGAFGNIKLDTVPAELKVLLGSCSAGGACTYHEDVQGGSLVTRYTGPENYALKSDWKYIENTDKATQVSSKDAKFQMDAAGLAKVPYIIVFNTAGYPEGLEGTVNSELYAFATSTTVTGDMSLTIRGTEDGSTAIMGWDGKTWTKFEGSVDGKAITADVKPMKLYVAVR